MSDDIPTGSADQPENPPSPAATPATVHASSTAPRRATGRIVAVAVLIIVLLAGVGAAGYFVSKLSGSPEALMQQVPKDATMFASVYLDPSAGQKIGLKNLLSRFKDLPSEGDTNAIISDAAENMFGDGDLSFEKDIKPWLGSQVGLVSTNTDLAVTPAFVADSKDDALAKAFIENLVSDKGTQTQTADHEGITITSTQIDGEDMVIAVADGLFIMGENQGVVQVVVDSAIADGGGLDTAPGFKEAMNGLPKERLAVLYVDVRRVASGAMQAMSEDLSSTLPSPSGAAEDPTAQVRDGLQALEGLGMTVTAESDGLGMQLNVPMDASKLSEEQRGALGGTEPGKNDGILWTPEDAYGLVALNDGGKNLSALLRTALAGAIPAEDPAGASDAIDATGLGGVFDAASGDLTVQVSPGRGLSIIPGGTLMLVTDDDEGMKAALDRAIPTLIGAGEMNSSPLAPSDPLAVAAPQTMDSDYRGITITSVRQTTREANPFVPAWAVSDGMAVIGSNIDSVRQAIDAHLDDRSVASTATYEEAIGHGDTENSAMMFVDIQKLWTQIGPMAAADDPESDAVIGQFSAFLMTQTTTDSGVRMKMFVLFTDAGDDTPTG